MLHFDIPQTWDMVRQIRSEVETLLQAYPKALREAAMMTASELAENAIKYGTGVAAAPQAVLEVRVHDNQVVIEARNGVCNDTHADFVQDTVHRISDTEDAESLYVGRLMQLAAGKEYGKSQFGLFRVAYEGQFSLACRYEDNVLTVIATRDITHATA